MLLFIDLIKFLYTSHVNHSNLTLMTHPVGEEKYEPKSFQEAWWHKDLEEREKWRTAIKKEFHNMIRRGVWRKRSRAGVSD